jgi:hypothetical protein
MPIHFLSAKKHYDVLGYIFDCKPRLNSMNELDYHIQHSHQQAFLNVVTRQILYTTHAEKHNELGEQCSCCELKPSPKLPARNFKNVAPTSVLGFTVQLKHVVK